MTTLTLCFRKIKARKGPLELETLDTIRRMSGTRCVVVLKGRWFHFLWFLSPFVRTLGRITSFQSGTLSQLSPAPRSAAARDVALLALDQETSAFRGRISFLGNEMW